MAKPITPLNLLVKKLTAKDGGKKQLNAGEARRVMKKVVDLSKADAEFKSAFDGLVNG